MLAKNFTRSSAAAGISSASASFDVAERTTDVSILTASGFDPGAVIIWAIVGGADSALFEVNPATGLLRFRTAQSFVAPADVGANNVYDVVVRATDGTSVNDQTVAITVLDGPDVFTGTAGNDVL